jgi:hypothetical protein
MEVSWSGPSGRMPREARGHGWPIRAGPTERDRNEGSLTKSDPNQEHRDLVTWSFQVTRRSRNRSDVRKSALDRASTKSETDLTSGRALLIKLRPTPKSSWESHRASSLKKLSLSRLITILLNRLHQLTPLKQLQTNVTRRFRRNAQLHQRGRGAGLDVA